MIRFSLRSFGVGISIESNDGHLLERFEQHLLPILFETHERKTPEDSDHLIGLYRNEEIGTLTYLFENEFREFDGDSQALFKLLRTLVRVTIAANCRDRLFIHAGAVEWKGRGLLLPGISHSGKTSLVVELCRLGATYYSDEYGVVDDNGLMYPFPKVLSVRGDGGRFDQTDVDILSLGAKVGKGPVPVSMILFTEFEDGSDALNLEKIDRSMAILELVPHAIPFAKNAEFSLKMLEILTRTAEVMKGARPDVAKTGPKVLELLEKQQLLG